MRKALALSIVLLITLLSLVSTIFIKVNGEKENVVISEKVLYGDRKYAENIKLSFISNYQNHLFWNTQYTIGDENSAKTDFVFNKTHQYNNSFEGNLILYTVLHYTSIGGLELEEGDEMMKAYSDLIAEAEPHVEIEKEILISDYCDYYPVYLDVSIPGHVTISSRFGDYLSVDEENFIKTFREFFKIPVIDNHRIKISITVDENGEIYRSGSATSYEGIPETADDYGFYAESVSTDDEFFIFFSNKTHLGKSVDTSEIPGGYGVYSLPFSGDGENVNLDGKNLKNIFPLPDESEVYGLYLSEDNKKLYVMIKENGVCKSLIIDADTYEKLDEFVIAGTEEEKLTDNVYLVHMSDEFILATYYTNEGENYYSVFTPDEKGKMKNEFAAPLYVTEYISEKDEHINYGAYPDHLSKIEFDGEYLYIISDISEHYYDEMCPHSGVNFAVYNKDGLLYHGEYDSSLSAGYDGNFDSSYYVRTNYDSKLDFTLPKK